MTKWLVIYRPKDALQCETKYFGPFNNFSNAEAYLAKLPPVADCDCKFIQETDAPVPVPDNTYPRGWEFAG